MTRTEKCSDWARILTTVSSHFFKNILLLAIFSYLALLKSLSHRMDNFCWLCYYITMSHYKIDKNKEEKWFSSYKKLKINFLYIWQGLDPGSGSGIRIRIEILGWIRIRIERMRIRNTGSWQKKIFSSDFTGFCHKIHLSFNFELKI